MIGHFLLLRTALLLTNTLPLMLHQTVVCARRHTWDTHHVRAAALTPSQAESLRISSHSPHSSAKRLKCHKRSCSRSGQWQLSKPLLPYHSAHIPYPVHSCFLLTSSLFSYSSLLLPPLLLSDLSFFPPLVQRLHNAHQLFRGKLPVSWAYPIRARASALMGSRCTCYRHQGTLERQRVGRREQKRQLKRREGDKTSEPTQTNRSADRGACTVSISPLL